MKVWVVNWGCWHCEFMQLVGVFGHEPTEEELFTMFPEFLKTTYKCRGFDISEGVEVRG